MILKYREWKLRLVDSMKSLYDLYSEEKKSYYGIEISVDDLFEGNTEENDECEEFIKQHFKLGKKMRLMDIDFIKEYKRRGKHIHTVSLYLLGASVYSYFGEKNIKENLKKFLPHLDKWYNFKYTWYLTTMYHDLASCIEIGKIASNDSEVHKSLDFHLGENDIFYSPYEVFPYKEHEIPFRFSQNLIKNYFYYRASMRSCEHGILAGYLFFDRFIKWILERTCDLESRDKDAWIKNENIKLDNLNYNKEFVAHTAYIADAIICHNIWMGGENEKEIYSRYGLTPLLYTEHPENRLSAYKFPLQFILCFLDTIEPIKRFSDKLEPLDILKNIYIDYKDNKSNITIDISWKSKIEIGREFERWETSILSLENWMQVGCKQIKNNSLRITINKEYQEDFRSSSEKCFYLNNLNGMPNH